VKKAVVVLLTLTALLLFPVGRSAPDTYSVVRGDTLGRIGKSQSVSVTDLREWNGLTGDLIEVDQVLKLGEGGPGVPVWRLLTDKVQAMRESEDGAVAEAPREAPALGKKSRKTRRKTKRRVAGPGSTHGSDESLLDDLPPEFIDDSTPWPPLKMPAKKRCLAADAGIGEGSFGRSQGLEPDQVSASVNSHQKQTLRCFDDESGAAGEVLLDLVVGCDGRVLRSSVDSHDTGSSEFALCVADVFRYASFPPHGRDEVEFSVPLRFTE
jgi:LysM repeat protein